MEFWQIVLLGLLFSISWDLGKIAHKLSELVELHKHEKPSYWNDEQ